MNFKHLFNQVATLWERSSTDGYGKPSFGSPSSIYVRWEEGSAIARGPGGAKEVVFSAIVYSGDSISKRDYLYLGESEGADPLAVSGAREVLRVDEIKDLNGVNSLFRAYLKEA